MHPGYHGSQLHRRFIFPTAGKLRYGIYSGSWVFPFVGLGFDPSHPKIQEVLKNNQPDRSPYINAILDRLRTCGIDPGGHEDICQLDPGSKHIGRMQIAQAMVRGGLVKDVEDAFRTYIDAVGKKLAFAEKPLRFPSVGSM